MSCSVTLALAARIRKAVVASPPALIATTLEVVDPVPERSLGSSELGIVMVQTLVEPDWKVGGSVGGC